MAQTTSGALTTFNVSNPSNITHLGAITGSDGPNHLNAGTGVFVVGDVAFVVAAGNNSLSTFNVSNPSSIVHLGNISGAGTPYYLNDPYSVQVLKDIAYVASYLDNALTTFNVSNPSNITHLGNISGKAGPILLFQAYYAYVSGDVAFVVSAGNNSLSTFNVSNASKITLLGNISGVGAPNYIGGPTYVFVTENTAYVLSQTDNALSTFHIPYPSQGNYTSQILDSGGTASWDNITWRNVTSIRTNLTVEYRTSNDSSTWSPLIAINSSQSPNVIARYFQFRANLKTNDTIYTPILEWVNISYTNLSFTGSSGNFNTTFTAPGSLGNY